MIKTNRLIAIFLIMGLASCKQKAVIKTIEVPQSFKHLKIVELGVNSKESPRVFIEPSITEIINKSVDSTHFLYHESSDEVGQHEFVVTKLNQSKNRKYHIIFDYGMSEDPNFSIYQEIKDSLKHICSLPGLVMYIPGNGNIYIEGHTNNFFNERKKFKLIKDTLIETKQPFLYVGLKTRTNDELKIYKTKEQKDLVASLPKDAEIEVLINDNEYYLIKTSFGLVGWWKFDVFNNSEAIKSIYFKGD